MMDLTENKYSLHIFIIIILLAMSFFTVIPVLNMVLLGAMIAYGLTPIARKIQTKVKYSSISIFIAIILVVIPLILLFAYIFYEITIFANIFFSSSNIVLGNGMDLNQTLVVLTHKLPVELQGFVNPYLSSISGSLENVVSYVLHYLVSLVKSFSDILIQLFVLVCSI